MFDKLKGALGDKAFNTAANKLAPLVKEKLEGMDLNPAWVADDEKYKSYVVGPALLAITAGTSGVSNLIPNFDSRFSVAMLHLRNELMVIDQENNKVALVPDYQARLPAVLAEGLNKPI